MDALALGKSGEHSSSSSCSRLCLEQPLRVSRALQTSQVHPHSIYTLQAWTNYRLTQSASELSGFTCTRSLTMNEKFEYRKIEAAECGIENFEFIVSEREQVNPDNSRAMRGLTFLLFKLNTLRTNKNRQTMSQPKPWCNDSGALNLHHGYYTTIMTSRRLFSSQCHVVQINQSENRNSYIV